MIKGMRYDHLEMARIIGEPVDPRRPYPLVVNAVCEIGEADPDEYVYQFDVLQDTDKIYTITSTGALTTEAVTPDTPTALTFADYASPEYYIKLTALTGAKERTFARKLKTINRAMNAYENYKIIDAINTSSTAQGNVNDLKSGETSFNYAHLIDQIDQIIDYSENYVLIAGTQIDKDIKLWDWTDNKFHSLKQAFEDLGVSLLRINQTVTADSTSTSVLASTVSYLVGTKTEEPGKPVLFVRKRLNDVERLGDFVYENQQAPQRLVFVSPNPVTVSSVRYLAVAITGFEEYTLAVTNPYSLSKFTRSV